MVQNLNDSSLEWLVEAVLALQRENPIQSTSVSRGRLRFIGGLLRVDSGGRVEIVGTLQVDGDSTFTGNFTLVGPWAFDGNGEISGNVRVLGQFDVEGPWKLIGEGDITGNVDLTGVLRVAGRIEVDGSGRIQVGGMTLDPESDGGAVIFGNDSKLYSNDTAIGLRNGNSSVTVGDDQSVLIAGGKAVTVATGGISLTGIREVSSTDGLKWLGVTTSGEIVRVSPSVGGPGGSLSWPFPPSMVTSEYGPRESPGEGASTFHQGIDFGAAEGTPIPASASGVVELAGYDGGYGNSVVINHGGGMKTRYAHMQTTPLVSVGQGVAKQQNIGPVGNTGTSFGAHLHFEVEVNGVKVNPRSKLPPS